MRAVLLGRTERNDQDHSLGGAHTCLGRCEVRHEHGANINVSH